MAHAHKHFGAEKVVTGETPHASSDMNVTPLIDVLLVLLIIFMAALPLSQKGVDVNLPLETNKPAQNTPSEQIVLIKADEDVEYGAVMAAMDSLRQAGVEDIGLITDPKTRAPEGGTGGK